MTYSADRYRYNNHSFYVFELAAWYYYYLLRVNSPSNLFSNSEQGVWYNPSDLTTLFQDSAGITPVTAAGQTVGLMLDKSGRGNHATQSVTDRCPKYGFHPITGLRNVANGSADFAGSRWVSSFTNQGITITRGAITTDYVEYAVTGTAAATVGIGPYDGYPVRTAAAAGGVFIGSTIVQVVVGSAPVGGGIRQFMGAVNAGGSNLQFTHGSIVAAASETTISVSYAMPANTASAYTGFDIWVPSGATANFTIRIKQPQLERGSTRTAYQANYSQYNVTEAGVASAYYLAFDGVDDGMATSAINFSATDAVTVFAGIRKLGTAASGLIVELSADLGSNIGTFALAGPANTNPNYFWSSRGTIAQSVTPIGFPAPITNVLTGLGNVAADISTLRVNGTQVAENTGDQGVSNYLTYPLFIGRRGGATIPFNGNIYSLIVRGVESTTGQITSTESWVNGKTGAY
jgi:hypothetical protein